MLKKWRRTIKVFATTLILLIYVTVGLFNSETLRGGKSKKTFEFEVESVPSSDPLPVAVKTIVAYSRDFRARQEIQERIECEAKTRPEHVREKDANAWKHDSTLGVYLFSAYYDDREEPYRYIRIIGLTPRKSSLYCQIWYQNNETTTYTTQRAVIREIWAVSWGVKKENCEEEIPSVISCLIPSRSIQTEFPSWVSFVNENCSGGETFVRITTPPILLKERKNFVVCVKPLHFTVVKEDTFKEWLDINERLGAQGILVYVSNSTSGGRRKFPLHRLLTKKIFKVPNFKCDPPSSYDKSIWRKRKLEIIAYNDCLYSNLYSSHFVIPLDVDEVIVPKIGNNWLEAFSSHFKNFTVAAAVESKDSLSLWPDNYSSFSVRNAYFFSAYPKEAIMLPKPHQNSIEKLVNSPPGKKASSPALGTSIFDRTIRSYRLSPSTDSVKSFVYVPRTLSVFNHFTFHVLGNAVQQYVFPQNVFQLNHYRNSCDAVLIDGCQYFLDHIIHDDTLEKFRSRNRKH